MSVALIADHRNSSNLHSSLYDPNAQELHITFRGKNGVPGKTYKYSGVPMEVFNGLKTASSAGQYFAQNIKDQYAAQGMIC